MVAPALRDRSGAAQSASDMSAVTEDRMALVALAEKHALGDFVRICGHYTHHQLMERDAQSIYRVTWAILRE